MCCVLEFLEKIGIDGKEIVSEKRKIPTLAQKRVIVKSGLDPIDWHILKETNEHLHLVSKVGKMERIIAKQ